MMIMDDIKHYLGVKTHDTSILEALESNDENKLKRFENKFKSLALAMCTLLEDYRSYRHYVINNKKDKMYKNGGEKIKDVAMERDKKLAQISLLLKLENVKKPKFLNEVVPFGYYVPKPCTPLVCAVNSLDADMVQLLINKGADPKLILNNLFGEPTNSALHEACRCNKYLELNDAEKEQRLKIINLLLDKGADVNSKITFEKKHMSGNISLCYRTPLMVALCDNLDDVVVKIFKTLLEREEYDLSVKGELFNETIKELVKGKKQSSHRDAILNLIAEVEARPKPTQKADGRRSRVKRRSGTKKDVRSHKKKSGRSHKKKRRSSQK